MGAGADDTSAVFSLSVAGAICQNLHGLFRWSLPELSVRILSKVNTSLLDYPDHIYMCSLAIEFQYKLSFLMARPHSVSIYAIQLIVHVFYI